MQLHSYTTQQNTPKTFSVVLFNHTKDGAPLELESDINFNAAIDRARHFPLLSHERVAVFRGAFNGNGGAREIYARTGKQQRFTASQMMHYYP